MIFNKYETKTHNIYCLSFIKFKFRKQLNNNIFIVKDDKRIRINKIKGLKIQFNGENATILLHSPLIDFDNCYIYCGNNSFIDIKSSKHSASNLKISAMADNSSVFIDKDFSCTCGATLLLGVEHNKQIKIGKDCMFAANITLRTTDGHTIADKLRGGVVNEGGNVTIGNHVWLAKDVKVLKGVSIADNCVVGTGSIVTKSLNEENCIYAGIPAKKIRSDIDWYRESIPDYLKE